jgi:autotransporter-associated beta strand protein
MMHLQRLIQPVRNYFGGHNVMASPSGGVKLALAMLGLSLLARNVVASTWTNLISGSASGVWGVAANWSGGVPNGVDAVGNFSTLSVTEAATVTNETARTVGSLLFAGAVTGNDWTLTGSALTLGVSSGTPTINVINQTATLSMVLGGVQGFTKIGLGTLWLNNTETYAGPTAISGGVMQLPAAPPIPSGTVGYWQFNNATNLGLDSSGLGNTLQTASGAPVYSAAGKFGGALYLNGSSTLTTAGFPDDMPTNSNSYTIAVWEKAAVGCPNNGGFVGWGTGGGGEENGLRLNGLNSVDNYWFANDFAVSGLVVNPMDGNWHAIVVTWNGTTQTMYVDGVNVGTRTPTAPNVQGENFVVGGTVSDVPFEGWVENLLIVNRALTTTEVASYQAGYSSLNSLPMTTAVQMSDGGELNLNGTSQAIGSLTGDATTSVLLGENTLTVNNTANTVFGGTISGAGSLDISGAGTLTLSGTNTYTGGTTINGGTLVLSVPAGATSVVSNSASISVSSGATLDVSGVSSGFQVVSGQMLGGSGAVNGTTTIDPGATLQPEPGGSGITTLMFSNGLTLAGNVILNINRTNSQKADLITAPSLALGGSVTIQNAGPTPVLGDTFQLFNISGTISNAGYYPVLPVLGSGVHWDYSQLATNGTITVASGAPTLFNVKTFGAMGNGVTDDSTAINNAIQSAIAAGPGSTVYFPDGTYYTDTGGFSLNNAKGVTIEGDTNSVLVNGSWGNLGSMLNLNNCSNCVVENLIVQVQPRRFTQGIVTSVAANASSITVGLGAGYEPLGAAIFTNLADDELCFWTDPTTLAYDKVLTGNNITGVSLISGSNWTINTSIDIPTNEVGKTVAVWNDAGGWAMNVSGCSGNTVISNFTYYGGGSGATVGMNNNLGPVLLSHVTTGVPPGSGDMIAAGGGYNAQGDRAPITMDTVNVSRTETDTLDVGTDLAHILATNSSTQIVVENTELYEPGDTVQIWDWTYTEQHVRDTATVTAASLNGNNQWVLTLNHPVQIINTGAGPGDTDWSAQEQDGIDRCIDIENAAPGTVIKNSFFQTSGRTFNMKAINCIITNNYFYDTPWNIFCAAETFWHGGPAPTNLKIVNNTFNDIDVAPIEVETRYSQWIGGPTNIFISGNYFTNCGADEPGQDGVYGPRTDIRGAGVCLRNVTGAIVTNNYFDGNWGPSVVIQLSTNVQVVNNTVVNAQNHFWSDFNNYGCVMSAVMAITNSYSMDISGNLVADWGQYGTTLVSSLDAQSIFGMNNGIYLTDQSYNLVNGLSGLSLDGTGTAGVSVTQESSNDGGSQQWKLNPAGNGNFTLTCLTNGLNTDVNNAINNGSPLLLENPTGAAEQLWTLTPVGNTNVLLVNNYSGLAASVQTTSAGETVAQQTTAGGLGQQWNLLGSPADVLATAGYNQVFLSWKALTGAISYNVERSLVSGQEATIATGVTNLTYIDSGLTTGVTYYYRISAVDSAGETPNSPEVSAMPLAPASLLSGEVAGYWPFTNANNLGADASGLGNKLKTANGAPIYSAANSVFAAGSLYLNGSSTMSILSGAFPQGIPTNASSYTIAVWEKAAAGCPNDGGFVGWGTGGDSDNNLRLNGPNSVVNYWFANDFTVSGLAVNPMDGNWHAIAVTWDGTTQTMYVDGVNAGTRTPGTLPTIGGANFIVGKTTSDVNFEGWMENLLIANVALTPAQIASYQVGFAAPPAPPTGLTATGGNGQVALRWTASPGATSYVVGISTNGGESFITIANPATTNYMSAGLTGGTTYYYVVSAANVGGVGADSAPVSVSLTPPELGLSVNGSTLAVSWPGWANNLMLVAATNLTPPVVWSSVTNQVSSSNGVFNVSLPIGSGEQFFRLISQ